MNKEYSVSLKKIMDEIGLEPFYMPKDPNDILIYSSNIDRPGLELVGHLEYFDNSQIVVLGMTEYSYLARMEEKDRLQHLEPIISRRPPAIIIARGITPTQTMIDCVKEYEIPLLTTTDDTSSMTAALVSFLNVELAPRITRHGVLVEVYGEGCLIIGNSGVGKSETAIELIKRGHRLVADDAVEIKRVSKKSLVGSSPDNIRHFIELRGIGIVDVKMLYGVECIKEKQVIDLVIQLQEWKKDLEFDRMGMDDEYIEYLDTQVVCHSVPIRPGRNLAVICETAAVNHRQKKMGYNAAQELYRRVQENLVKNRNEE